MPLVACRDCGHRVSDAADACVKCGAPVDRSEGRRVLDSQARRKADRLKQEIQQSPNLLVRLNRGLVFAFKTQTVGQSDVRWAMFGVASGILLLFTPWPQDFIQATFIGLRMYWAVSSCLVLSKPRNY